MLGYLSGTRTINGSIQAQGICAVIAIGDAAEVTVAREQSDAQLFVSTKSAFCPFFWKIWTRDGKWRE